MIFIKIINGLILEMMMNVGVNLASYIIMQQEMRE